MGFGDGFEIPHRETSGGLSIAWKLGVHCESGFCNNHIVNLIVYSNPLAHHWLMSFVYGPTTWFNKDAFWYSLAQYGRYFEGP